MSTKEENRNKKILEVINKTGFFLQERCYSVFYEKHKEWEKKKTWDNSRFEFTAETEVPFTYPPTSGGILGQPGSIDVLGRVYRGGGFNAPPVVYVIECKRPDPQAKHWVFFTEKILPPHPTFLMNGSDRSGTKRTLYRTNNISFRNLELEGSLWRFAYQCVEVNEQLTGFNRNQAENIYKPLFQVSRGLIAISTSMAWERKLIRPGSTIERDGVKVHFLPVILTTAKLYELEHQASDVDLNTGELILDKSSIREVPFVTYNFALPDYLAQQHFSPHSSLYKKLPPRSIEPESTLAFEYLTMFVINTSFFEEFIDKTIPDDYSIYTPNPLENRQ